MSNGLSNVRVSYTLGATVKLQDFSNVKPEYTLSADVEDGVDPTGAKDKLKALVHSWLEAEVEEIQRDLR